MLRPHTCGLHAALHFPTIVLDPLIVTRASTTTRALTCKTLAAYFAVGPGGQISLFVPHTSSCTGPLSLPYPPNTARNACYGTYKQRPAARSTRSASYKKMDPPSLLALTRGRTGKGPLHTKHCTERTSLKYPPNTTPNGSYGPSKHAPGAGGTVGPCVGGSDPLQIRSRGALFSGWNLPHTCR